MLQKESALSKLRKVPDILCFNFINRIYRFPRLLWKALRKSCMNISVTFSYCCNRHERSPAYFTLFSHPRFFFLVAMAEGGLASILISRILRYPVHTHLSFLRRIFCLSYSHASVSPLWEIQWSALPAAAHIAYGLQLTPEGDGYYHNPCSHTAVAKITAIPIMYRSALKIGKNPDSIECYAPPLWMRY